MADLCTNPARADGTTLTFVSWGGAYQEGQSKGWVEPYAALTGVTFLQSSDSSNATIKAQVEAGQVTWDIVDVGNEFGLDVHASFLEPLDFAKIHKDEFLEGFVGDYRVPTSVVGAVVGYNTEKTAGAVPQGWADFFDTTKFPGKRGMYDYSLGGVFEVALLGDGVAPADLYPLDLDRAVAKLDTIKDDLVFWGSGAESQDLIGKGEVTMSFLWNGRGFSAKNTDNKPVEMQWDGMLMTGGYFVVPKGSPNKDAAMDFIAWVSCKENSAALSKYLPYGPMNKNAETPADVVPHLPTSHINATTAYSDDAWLAENAALLEETYQAWKTR